MRTRLFVSVICVFSLFGFAPFAAANSISLATQAFADSGITLANGSATGNLATATNFTLGDWISTGNTGFLAGMPTQNFGSVTFSVNNPSSFTFGNGVFGTFTSTSITQLVNVPGVRAFDITGEFTPGTFGGVTGGPFAADFTISFTQTPPGSGSLSASGTFQTVIPEPGTLSLLGTGMLGIGTMLRRKLFKG